MANFSTSDTVCAVTGCGTANSKDERGGEVLWGMWLCKKHLHDAQTRGDALNDPPSSSSKPAPLHPPPQPMKASKKVKKGRGGTRAKPADMGVSMEDILFMAEMVRECTAMRVRTAQHKSDSDRHKKEVKNLEKDLEAERACVTRANTEIDRMKREGGRHTLENQVEEWRKKAEDCKTKAEEVRRASKTAVQKALKERDKARKDKNGFVQELQKNMECGGVQMYCIERGDEGLFIPKNQMHVQLKAWEEQQEESWKEIGVLKGKLLQAVQMMRETKGNLSQMEYHAAALEQAVRAMSIKGKKEKEKLVVKVAEEKKKTDRMASKWQTEKKKAAADTKKTRGAMETAEAEINSIEAALAAAKLHLHDSSRRHEDQVKKLRRVNDSRLAGLEKFRLQATRALERTHKNQNKDWSKVSHASHQNLFCFFCVRSCHFVFASAFSSTLNLHLRLTISANKIISNLPCLTPPPSTPISPTRRYPRKGIHNGSEKKWKAWKKRYSGSWTFLTSGYCFSSSSL